MKTEGETREARNKDSERADRRRAWPAQVREAVVRSVMEQGLVDLCRGAQVRRAVHDGGDVGEGVSGARGRGAQGEEAGAASEPQEAAR